MRIAIVEDDRFLLENLRILLSGEQGITVTGAYSSAEDAIQGVTGAPPDIMLTDLGLPGISGIDLIQKIKTTMHDIEIMAYTIFEEKETIFSALRAGASGYVLKGSTPRELVEALYTLHNGGAPMSPKIARAVIQEFQSVVPNEQYLLSPREKEILRSIEKGLTYKEIAKTFNISPHTVHTHIKKIYEKLQATSRQQALQKAKKKGII